MSDSRQGCEETECRDSERRYWGPSAKGSRTAWYRFRLSTNGMAPFARRLGRHEDRLKQITHPRPRGVSNEEQFQFDDIARRGPGKPPTCILALTKGPFATWT